jgi:hypothetical protein
MSSSSTTGTQGTEAPGQRGDRSQPQIDLQALAERVYQLLKEEARLECERLGRPQAQ